MPEHLRLFLDQMLRIEVAEALRNDGHNVMRTSYVGQARADDYQVLLKAIDENRILITIDDHFGNWDVSAPTIVPRPKIHRGHDRRFRLMAETMIKALEGFQRKERIGKLDNRSL